MLTKAYPPWIGGVETHVKQLAEGLAARDHKVTVLACSPNGQPRRIAAENLDVVLVPRWATVRSMPISPGYPFHLRRFKPDIVHIHHPHPLGFISQDLFGPQAPLVITWHSDIVRQKRLLQFFKPFQNRILNKARKIIVTSPNLMENSPHLRPYQDKCVPIPLGIDLSEFDRRLESPAASEIAASLPSGVPHLLFVGRLVEYKGLDFLIQAMQKIEGVLHVIGVGRLLDRYEAMVSELGVTDRVVFHGEVSDDELAGYYSACDLFVLPSVSNNEAFGIVQLEAMAAGKPVVSTNLPTGVPFVNRHESTGFVVPPEDSEALADAINALLSNRELRQEMGTAARKRVEETFGVEDMVEKTMETYALLG